jgi:AraC-like DNA-binding protein
VSATPRDARAILHPNAGRERFAVGWVPAAEDLAGVVGRHWTVRWAVDDPYVQQVISHPVVQLAVERHHDPDGPRDVAEVHGVVRGTFERRLVGSGRVHGIRFRAGTFRDLLGADLSTLTDRIVPADQVLGPTWTALARDAIDLDDDAAAAHLLEDGLRARLPDAPDPAGLEVADLVERVEEDRTITQAAQLADLAGVTARTLQRSFARYVGVGPKWVVRTYRLHEAAERLAAGDPVDLAELAAELGYSDQPHLTGDFKRAVGRTPADYLRAQAVTRGA